MDDKELERYEVDGQMTIDEWLYAEPPGEMIGVSKVFARAKKKMSLAEFKTFVYCLCHVRWKDESMPAAVCLDKRVLSKIIDVSDEPAHLSRNLRLSIGNLIEHSVIEFSARDRVKWKKGALVTDIALDENGVVKVWFNKNYKGLFSGLDKDFILMWSRDIFQMQAEKSVALYEDLRLNCDTRVTNSRVFTLEYLKGLFDMPDSGRGSYVMKDGRFNYTGFERKVLDPVCEDLSKCEMIQLVSLDDRPYRKLKRGRQVIGYEFVWEVSNRPRIADAHTTQETRRAIEKNPKVMKIAVDAAAGIRHASAAGKKNQFTDFENQNTGIDFDSLEEELLARTAAHLREEERS